MSKPRILILFVLTTACLGVLVAKAAWVQLFPSHRLEELNHRQYQKILTLRSRRGAILDRKGRELAVSVTSYSLYVDPSLIENPKQVARKLAMVEGDLQRAEERAESGENKIVDLEEELRMIGENMKALEVAEEKAQQREEEYKKTIKQLSEKFTNAEAR